MKHKEKFQVGLEENFTLRMNIFWRVKLTQVTSQPVHWLKFDSTVSFTRMEAGPQRCICAL